MLLLMVLQVELRNGEYSEEFKARWSNGLEKQAIDMEAVVARERGFKAVRSSHSRFWGNKVRYQAWDKDQNGKLHYVPMFIKVE